MKKIQLDLACFALGALLTFAFAPYEIFPIAVLAPAGLLLAWLDVSPKQAFWRGFLFGLGLFGFGIYWIYISVHDVAEVPLLLALFITGGLIAVLALIPGSIGYLLNRYFPTTSWTKILCAFPAIWVFSEWIRAWIFSGFPWFFMGYSQTNSPLRGFAPILSVYGVSLMVLVSSALLVNAWLHYRQKKYSTLSLNLLSMTALWTLGGLLTLVPWTNPSGQTIPVALVQGNIPQTLKWSPESVQLSFDRYTDLSKPWWGKAKIIIWPEAAIPMTVQNASDFIQSMDDLARSTDTQLILGIPIGNQENGYYNAVITLGAKRGAYLKRRLVPFGEYIPYMNLLGSFLNFMNIPMANTFPGKVKQDPLSFRDIKILTSICYEIGFPELIRSTDSAPGFVLTVLNDAWFGKSNARTQHLQMAAMRAIELGRPVITVSNDGITAMINPNGSVAAEAPEREAFVLEANVQPMQGITPWMRNGTGPILFILLCLLFTAARSKRKASKLAAAESAL